MFSLEFPPINEVIRWKEVFASLNKVGIIACLAAERRAPRTTSGPQADERS